MKRVEFTKQFKKRLRQRYGHQPKVIERFQRHLELFSRGIRKEPINDHSLTGKFKDFRAFSVGGDVRVVYREAEDCYLLLDIGSHNQVY